jgi:hypothetical protein
MLLVQAFLVKMVKQSPARGFATYPSYSKGVIFIPDTTYKNIEQIEFG